MYVCHDQPVSTGAMSAYPYSPALEAAFRFVPKFGELINTSVRRGNQLLVPRNLVPLGKADYRIKFKTSAINCKKPARSQEQIDLIKNSVELLQAGVSHVFEAPTGFGKSYCGAAVAAAVGQPTLIIVTKQDLVHSWRDTLINLIGVPATEIGMIQQDTCEYVGKRFVIAMIHSLIIPDRYPEEMYKAFGLVIFDETHRVAAESFVTACHMLPAALRLGLSATTNRPDGKWLIVEAHIGQVLVVGTTVPMKAKVLVRKTGWKMPRQQGGKPMYHAPGKMMAVTKVQGSDMARNALIVEFVAAAYKAGRNILILSDLVDGHLVILFHALGQVIPAEDIDYYIGGRTKAQLTIAKTRRVCLATYAMCSEGTDNPRWDSLVLATPRANIKQSIGRILRSMEGKKQPVCLDLVDYDSIFGGYYLKREKDYYSIGAEIVKVN